MSIQSDAEIAANVQVGGTDRSGLFYDSVAHVWYTKNQSGTLAPLVNGVSSISNADGTLTISPTTGASVASRPAITGDIGIPIASNIATIPAGTVTDAKAALSVKPACTVVATTNQALTGIPTIDGQLTAAGSIILLTAQSTGAENGPWVAAAGAWSRPTWYPSAGTTQAFQFITTLIRLGTVYQGSVWRMTTAGAVTIDTTSTTWVVTPKALNSNTVIGSIPINIGGTNSIATLNNNRVMKSSGGAIIEAAAITGNKALASDSNGIPVASTTTDTELGFVSGVSSAIQTQLGNKQPLDSDLTTIAGLTATTDSFLQSKASTWTTRTPTQVTADLIPASTSLPGTQSAADKQRSDNWYNKAVYNVLDNGISPSNSGATNVTAWNALMTTLANSTASVYFPPGVYDIASVCNIPAGVHIRVMGAGVTTRTSDAFGTIIRTTSGTADMFTCSDWYDQFTDLTFRSSVVRTAGAAITSGDNVGIEVINCNFNAQFNGILFSGGANAGNIGYITNCHFTDTVNFSIKVDGTNCNAIITACTADCAPASVAHLEINACGSLLIDNCDFIRATNNVRLNPDSGTKGVFSVYFINTFFDTAAGSSVKFMGGAAGTNIQRVKFVSCWFSGSVNGCEFAAVTSTNKATAIDFVACDIYSNSANGILATEVQDFSMTNCRVAGNTTAGLNTVATAGSVTKFNVQNNTFGPTAGVGANGIGINIQAGTYGGYNVTGNTVGGNTSNNNVLDAGSVATTDLKKVADNLGHLLKGAIASQGATPVSVPVTTETLVLAARIPANAVTVGQVFRIRGIGVASAANAVTWRLKVGTSGTTADTVTWVAIASAVTAANCRHGAEIYLTVRSLGAGSVESEGTQHASTATTTTWTSAVAGVAATTAITTTAAWFITLTLSQTIGSSLIQQAVIEAL